MIDSEILWLIAVVAVVAVAVLVVWLRRRGAEARRAEERERKRLRQLDEIEYQKEERERERKRLRQLDEIEYQKQEKRERVRQLMQTPEGRVQLARVRQLMQTPEGRVQLAEERVQECNILPNARRINASIKRILREHGDPLVRDRAGEPKSSLRSQRTIPTDVVEGSGGAIFEYEDTKYEIVGVPVRGGAIRYDYDAYDIETSDILGKYDEYHASEFGGDDLRISVNDQLVLHLVDTSRVEAFVDGDWVQKLGTISEQAEEQERELDTLKAAREEEEATAAAQKDIERRAVRITLNLPDEDNNQ